MNITYISFDIPCLDNFCGIVLKEATWVLKLILIIHNINKPKCSFNSKILFYRFFYSYATLNFYQNASSGHLDSPAGCRLLSLLLDLLHIQKSFKVKVKSGANRSPKLLIFRISNMYIFHQKLENDTGRETLNANYIWLLCSMKFAFRVSHPVDIYIQNRTVFMSDFNYVTILRYGPF